MREASERSIKKGWSEELQFSDAHSILENPQKYIFYLIGIIIFSNYKNKVEECSAKSNLKIKDLTGAGDLFAGGFLHGYINNKTIKESLEIGTEMSSKIIQIIGARLKH